jgi:DNA-binding NarL/FixJ family response regulator
MKQSVRVWPARNERAASIVAGLLQREPGLDAECCSGETCGSAPSSADVVIIPVSLPDVRDLRHLKAALAQHRGAPLTVLGLYHDPAFIRLLREAGAAAFLPLDEAVRGLPPLIRRLTRPGPALMHAM